MLSPTEKGNKMSYQSSHYCEYCDRTSPDYLGCEACEGKHCDNCGVSIDDTECELALDLP
jgi:primosomal protein N'